MAPIPGGPSGRLPQQAPAVDYETVATVGTGQTLNRAFRGIHIVTAGTVELRSAAGNTVSFGTLSAGTWPYGGNYIVTAPSDAVLLY